jgi:hypothetical protein
MKYQFRKHYTLEEARSLLPQIRQWLSALDGLRPQLHNHEQHLNALMESGCDVGGKTVNAWIRAMAEMRELLVEFHQRQILIKDVERGLIDFPAIIGGKEVFLCWEKDEEDIEFWHDLDSGYASREKL